ncbi:MAG: LysM peptidoglycan-binding domain-containing protein [Candidatus Saccharibacteria bacterium]|nr:LysM peptidoglycan-binding domain-containing protein [Candidatus Saccharibacteria bacterium]
MTKKKRKVDFEKVKKFLPYFFATVLTISVAVLGSLGKYSDNSTLSMDAFAKEDYKVSVDQMTELYTVADLSSALRLASADDTAINYVTVTSMYNAGQTTDGKLEKPVNPEVSTSKGVIEYIVKDGDTMASIATAYGLTTDQIRWSNGLKTTDISVGGLLYLPKHPGIVYTVKSGDTIASIVSKYGSTVEEIDTYNYLNGSEVSEGMKILVAGGSLPETERPEYVAPVRTYYYAYTYAGGTAKRLSPQTIGTNWYGGGQCVGYALWYRNVSGQSPLGTIPTTWGNANSWASGAMRDGYRVDRTPEIGAVFQTNSGWFGHVGVVVGFNDEGIIVRETNYSGPYGGLGVVMQSVIPYDSVGLFYYIH